MRMDKPWDTVGQVGLKVDTLIEMVRELSERVARLEVPKFDFQTPIGPTCPCCQVYGPGDSQSLGLTQEEKDQLGTAALELDNPYNPRK